MTCNRLMVLLDIHRGTFCESCEVIPEFGESKHMATLPEDLKYLRHIGFITKRTTACGDAVSCTDDGNDFVDRVRRMPLDPQF